MSYTKFQHHIVFSTKERRPFLQGDRLTRTCEYIGGIIREEGGQMLAGGGMPDHVHVAAILRPTVAPADFVRVVKTNSSGWVHKTFPDLAGFHWQDGYAAFSVSASAMPRVIAYVRGQAEHHRSMSFQEELIGLLEKHGIEYDERYLFA